MKRAWAATPRSRKRSNRSKPDLERVDGTSVTLLISALGIHKGRTFSKALLKLAQARSFDLPDLRKTSEDEIIFQIERRMKAAGLRPGPGRGGTLFPGHGHRHRRLVAGDGEAGLLCRRGEKRSSPATRSTGHQRQPRSHHLGFLPCRLDGRGPAALTQLSACWRRTNRRSASSSCWPARFAWRRWRPFCAKIKCCASTAARLPRRKFPPRARPTCPEKKAASRSAPIPSGRRRNAASIGPARFWFQALGAYLSLLRRQNYRC
jgi:hypothetical protein